MNQTPPIPPPIPTRPSSDDQGAFRGAIVDFTGSIRDLRSILEALIVRFDLLADRMRKQLIGQLLAAAVFVVVSSLLLGAAQCQASRLSDATAKLEETARLLDSLRAEQDLTQRKVEDVKAQVQSVADDQPSIILTDAGAGKPPKPSIVVVKPAKPKVPAVVVPLEVPKAVVVDAGAP